MPHRSNYFLAVSYNRSPNKAPFQNISGQDVLETEAAFQLSQKIKLWQDIGDRDWDMWIGYTQRSFWQLYNSEDSSPFRDTNYEPELMLNYRTRFTFLGMNVRHLNFSFNHQSNGRSEPLSKSWNRLIANVGMEKGPFTLQLRTWYRIPESIQENDNPDIDSYLGPGELWAYTFWQQHRLGLMVRNNFERRDNRGALQLEWSFPVGKKFFGYVQYFNGYGECMLDYNHNINRIGVGFILKNW